MSIVVLSHPARVRSVKVLWVGASSEKTRKSNHLLNCPTFQCTMVPSQGQGGQKDKKCMKMPPLPCSGSVVRTHQSGCGESLHLL